jgi:hypothetical protein
VGVVTVRRLIFHVRRVDRDAARLLFRRRVDVGVVHRLAPPAFASVIVIAAVSVVLPWST